VAKSAGVLGKAAAGSKAGQVAAKLIPTAGKKAAKVIAAPTAVGAVTGAGVSEEAGRELVWDSLKGAAIGGVGAGVLSGAGKAIKGAVNKLNTSQLRKLGLNAKDFERLKPGEKEEIAKLSRDMKILTSSPKKTMENAFALEENATKRLADFRTKLGQKDVEFINKSKLTDDILNDVAIPSDRPTTKVAAQFAEGILEEAEAINPKDFASVLEFKKNMGEHFRTLSPQSREFADVKKTYAILMQNIDNQLDIIGKQLKDPNLATEFKKTSNEFRLSMNLARAAKRAAAQAEAARTGGTPAMIMNRLLGQLRPIKLVTSATAGFINPLLVPAKIAAEALATKYGASTGAKLQRLLDKGGPTAARLRDLLKAGKGKEAATIALTEQRIGED
jgi:hypothetical protein